MHQINVLNYKKKNEIKQIGNDYGLTLILMNYNNYFRNSAQNQN